MRVAARLTCNKMEDWIMPVDMTLYFDVIKQIHNQINRITYAKELNEHERLNQLNRLEHEISQKFIWARRSIDLNEPRATRSHPDKSEKQPLSVEVDVA